MKPEQIVNLLLVSLYHSRWQFALLFSGLCMVCFMLIATAKPSYKTSWTILLPGTDRSATLEVDVVGQAKASSRNAYANPIVSPKSTYKQIALSLSVVDRVAEKLGVEAPMVQKPNIKLVNQTPAMEFSMKGRSREHLANLAKAYNDSLHEIIDELRDNELDRYYEGVEGNMSMAKRRVIEAKIAIIQFQSKGALVSGTQFEKRVSMMEELKHEATKVSIQLEELKAYGNQLVASLDLSNAQLVPLVVLQQNPVMMKTLVKYAEVSSELASLQGIAAEKHPKRQTLAAQIDSLSREISRMMSLYPELKGIDKRHLIGLVGDQLSTIVDLISNRARIQGVQAQLASYQQNIKRYEKQVYGRLKDAAKLSDLEREYEIAEAIFSSALARLDTGRLNVYATYPMTQLLTAPGEFIQSDTFQLKVSIFAAILVFLIFCAMVYLAQVRTQVLLKGGLR